MDLCHSWLLFCFLVPPFFVCQNLLDLTSPLIIFLVFVVVVLLVITFQFPSLNHFAS